MSTHVTPRPDTGPGTRTATPRQLDWLRGELSAWSREGLLEAPQVEEILGHYRASRRVSVGRLLLGLGAVFVGVGVIWLVAANLDQLPPLGRFLAVTVIWLSLLVGGEVLAHRTGERWVAGRALVPVTRLLAALLFGAVVFQAAQSLQVPAYEPALVGWWAVGALLHAYVVRDLGPLLVGLLTGVGWFLWQVLWTDPSGLTAVIALLAGCALAVGVAAVHTRVLPVFSPAWREVGALLGLAGLFAAALPNVSTEDFGWEPWLVVGVAAAALAVAAGTILGQGTARLEPLAAVAVSLLAVVLVLWDTGTDTDQLTAGDWLHALVSVGAYVLVAVGVAVLGTLRDSWRLTALATAALVVFTTFQSFAVFAQIIQGAWLFLVLGLVFLGTGFLFDRARRGLATALENEEQHR
ncbi:DUF2157 domain-containing protein [Nocardioides euryhalodurans]|nr:DUF2157 domain-containing protein [Nocardioides euryhalodurans]